MTSDGDAHEIRSKRSSITSQVTEATGRSLPVNAVLLRLPSANKAQDPPVLLWGCPFGQGDQVVIALLMGAILLVRQRMESCAGSHTGSAACLALPLLHPVT